MPIKLIQVQRKLNVGINTVVEFLRKKGFEVEDNNPNTRIGDEQYALLVKEFGKAGRARTSSQGSFFCERRKEFGNKDCNTGRIQA